MGYYAGPTPKPSEVEATVGRTLDQS
jgi:hypothetical protein